MAFILLASLMSFGGDSITWTGCGITKKAFINELAAQYKKQSGVAVKISGGGATKGIRHTASAKSDMGGSCRHLTADQKEKDVKLHPVAWDAITVIVHPDAPISNLSHQKLKKIFTGKIRDWKQLGASESAPIEVFVRQGKISGVGLMARELVFANTDLDFAATKVFKSTGPLEKAVAANPRAIAFDGISSAKKWAKSGQLKIVKINNVAPTVKNISSGKYILFRPLYLVTAKSPSPKVKNFIKFARSEEGQRIIASQGTVTLKQGAKLWPLYRKHMKTVVGKHKGVFE